MNDTQLNNGFLRALRIVRALSEGKLRIVRKTRIERI